MLAALGFTRGVTLLAIFGLGVASLCLYTVGEREFAVVSQFGRSVRVESTPGLKLKLPAPFQTVTRFDRRLFALVPAPREFLTLGKQSVVATGLILWRVEDPAKYMRTVFDRVGAESRLADILFAEPGERVRPDEVGARPDQHAVPVRRRGGGAQDQGHGREGQERRPRRGLQALAENPQRGRGGGGPDLRREPLPGARH